MEIMSKSDFLKSEIEKCENDIINRMKQEYVKAYKQNISSAENDEEKMLPLDKWMRTKTYKEMLKAKKSKNKRLKQLQRCKKEFEDWFNKEYDLYVSKVKKINLTVKEMENYLIQEFVEGEKADDFIQKIIEKLDDSLYKYFSSSVISWTRMDSINIMYFDFYDNSNPYMISPQDEFCENYDTYIEYILLDELKHKKQSIYCTLKNCVKRRTFIKQNIEIYEQSNLWEMLCDKFRIHEDEIIQVLKAKYHLDYTIHLINTQNVRYKGLLDKYENYVLKRKIINEGLLQTLPTNYIDLFPFARTIHRKFILHIGGTNSGKTYSSIQALKNAKTGIYLGPLRLLAFEQYDKLNKENILCSLVTGEEKKEVLYATHQSSTIEMLNFSTHYDVAVIDEAQMICDSFRGGSWTNAIIGVYADEIHICAAPEAEDVIKKIITSCNDEYEVVYHTRNTPLIVETDTFEFEKDVRKGDALIVFSKRSVHAVANELKQLYGIKSSVIYGALPYDVRQNEVDKFTKGITDVVVTTDAIGLGMNLPIKRVVFLETKKFDGITKRTLNAKEIKQIAGRAGRFGIFNEGLVNSINDKNYIANCLEEDIPCITTNDVSIRLPEMIINIEGKLSEILEQWEKMEVKEGFKKADITNEKQLCLTAEEYTEDKKLIYDFITIPFNKKNITVSNLWTKMLIAKIEGEHLSFHTISPIYRKNINTMSLQELEEAYEICDLIFYYNEKFEESLESVYVMEEKEKISKAIIKLLDKQKLPMRKCKICGRCLSWNFQYNICDNCHRNGCYYRYY